ncbi:uncharacterized protein LOC143150008 isoform X2 [Ptiloglossa arizonensis]|uniref:uncharacterized protein LOC143150008 isoform X2 n=1 Tax=Ptiloglossa arizonensis TaxID=3350558 RepID=UPI003F9F0B47
MDRDSRIRILFRVLGFTDTRIERKESFPFLALPSVTVCPTRPMYQRTFEPSNLRTGSTVRQGMHLRGMRPNRVRLRGERQIGAGRVMERRKRHVGQERSRDWLSRLEKPAWLLDRPALRSVLHCAPSEPELSPTRYPQAAETLVLFCAPPSERASRHDRSIRSDLIRSISLHRSRANIPGHFSLAT